MVNKIVLLTVGGIRRGLITLGEEIRSRICYPVKAYSVKQYYHIK